MTRDQSPIRGSLLWSHQTPWTARSRWMRQTRSVTRPCPQSVPGQWSSDVTYIKTHKGWLYLSVVIDLFSRPVVGWSAQPRMTTDLALQALLAAVWRRKPKAKVMIHSVQGSQSTSREWQLFLSQHNLEASMSRRGNCHDNAVPESFFQLLKREPTRRRTYLTCEAARQDVFE
jgi:putative transposase